MKQIIIALIIGVAISLTACSDYLEPNPYDGVFTDESVWGNANYAKGVLYQAYRDFPNSYRIAQGQFLEYATDDAVTNNTSSGIRNLGLGILSSTSNPLDNWAQKFNNIRHINEFLENGTEDIIYFSADTSTNLRYIERLKGEALFLRAYNHWELLKQYGGLVDGQVMGIPVVKKVLTEEEAIILERPTYSDCIAAIIEDCIEAETYLPDTYAGTDPVTGVQHYGGATTHACRALRAVVSVYQASKAYNIPENSALWDTAASYLLTTLELLDGDINSNPLPKRNFNDPENDDVIWRGHFNDNLNYERDNYSPSLFGNGLTNPSQNLVDAFPDSEGFPIMESSVYDSDQPYLNRDSRFYDNILHNGSIFNVTFIETFKGGNDSREKYGTKATTTGYYLKKFLSTTATLSPVETGAHKTFYTVFGKTDLYLYLAEVLNEIEGPNGTSVCGVSAKEVLSKIRKRAGYITDNYLNSISTKDDLKELIKNERRIELCFEGFRFWDLRRWNEQIDGVEVKGMSILKDNATGELSYEPFTVETRKFQSIYMPLPYSQVILMKNVEQNDGWQ